MRERRFIKILVVLLITLSACTKRYSPPVISAENKYLVVEGNIDPGTDTTKILLSRTQKLSDANAFVAETGAKVTVVDDHNITHSLTETTAGVYIALNLNILASQTCKLQITTANGKTYTSDNIDVLNSPPIDSLPYLFKPSGVQFNIYTHDPSNKVRYYRWDYTDTWEYSALLQSDYKYVSGMIELRTNAPGDNVYNCWKTEAGAQILLGSTADLSNSVINAAPIDYVDVSSGKLGWGYSIQVHQYALSKDAYNYWENLKKNTEQLGSIFDAQPSDLKGNIHSTTDATEPVIGYISASTVTSIRNFFWYSTFPTPIPRYSGLPTSDACPLSTLPFEPQSTFAARAAAIFGGTAETPLVTYGPPGGPVLGYSYVESDCADCRFRIMHGSNTPPSFWPVNYLP